MSGHLDWVETAQLKPGKLKEGSGYRVYLDPMEPLFFELCPLFFVLYIYTYIHVYVLKTRA